MGRLRTSDREVMDCWKRSDLNQREYCKLHGLSLKKFGIWFVRWAFRSTGVMLVETQVNRPDGT